MIETKGALVGITTEHDFFYAAPSSASVLTVFEQNCLLARLPVSQIMPYLVVTVRLAKGKNTSTDFIMTGMVKQVSPFL